MIKGEKKKMKIKTERKYLLYKYLTCGDLK